MKIIFEKLETPKDSISIDFGNGIFKKYNVETARANGIPIPNNVTNYDNIKIKGSMSTFRNLDTIAGVKIVNEAVADHQIPINICAGYSASNRDFEVQYSGSYSSDFFEDFYVKVNDEYVSLDELDDASVFGDYNSIEERPILDTTNGYVLVRPDQNNPDEIEYNESEDYYHMVYGSGGEYLSLEDVQVKFDRNQDNFVADLGSNMEIPLIYENEEGYAQFITLPAPEEVSSTPALQYIGSDNEVMRIEFDGDYYDFFTENGPEIEIDPNGTPIRIGLVEVGEETYSLSQDSLNSLGYKYVGDDFSNSGNYVNLKEYKFDEDYVNSISNNIYTYTNNLGEVIPAADVVNEAESILIGQYLYYDISQNGDFAKTNFKLVRQ